MKNNIGNTLQNQGQNQNQWFTNSNKQQQMQQQTQQPIIIQRQQMQQGMGNFSGPAGYMRPRQPQMGGAMNQGGYQGVFNAEQQQGIKSTQQNAGVLTSQLQGGIQGHQVMGPPGSQHTAMQQQMMQNVRSPPPITSPRPALPSPSHHLPSHSPSGAGDLHNHLGHPHQSPIPAGSLGDNVMGDSNLNAQEQLTKFVEKL